MKSKDLVHRVTRWLRTRTDRDYAIGRHTIRLPRGHRLDYNQHLAPRYDSALGVLANLLWERSPDFSAIDIGANIGDTAALLCQRHDVRVLCVEGCARFLPLLERNAAVVGAQVRIEPVYLGVGPGAAPLARVEKDVLERFAEWNAYLASNRRHGPAVHYLDVCALHHADVDLAIPLMGAG